MGGRKRKHAKQEMLEIDESELGGDGDSDDGDGEKEGGDGAEAGLVSMKSITKLVKRAHATKADRMDSVADGREGRKKYGFQVWRSVVGIP